MNGCKAFRGDFPILDNHTFVCYTASIKRGAISINNFEFHSPTRVVFGAGTHKQIGKITASYGFKRVFLHYGGGSIKKTGLYDAVTGALRDNGVDFIELGGVQPNPTLSFVRQGIEMVRAYNADLVLAVGGGSAIGSAKAIAVGAKNDGDIWRFFMKEDSPIDALPMATILTLSATGSEMSSSAVITNETLNLKRGYNSRFHRPLFSILNPELTYTLPPYQTACGIVDIMMHTIERYMTFPGEAELTDRIAEQLLKTVIAAGKTAMRDPNDYDARANLMWAGSLSHNDLTGCGRDFFMASHQIEHEVSGMFPEVAHGAGLAVIFPKWARYVLPSNIARTAQYAVRVWNCEVNFARPERTALEGIERTEEYFKSIGMPSTLGEFGITADAIPEMARKCTNYGKRTLPGVVTLDEKEIAEILTMCL